MKKLIRKIRGLRSYYSDLRELRRQKAGDASFYFGKRLPILTERFEQAGTMSGHYFHQDLYVARQIYRNDPERHVDVGSRADGFLAHVAVFREIEVLDIREQHDRVENISFRRMDLMQLPEEMVDYCDSISSLHAVEHFGLGRYGDPVDYEGHLRGLENIGKIVKSGGRFYFSVPIGEQRIEFNAHRVFAMRYLLDLLRGDYELEGFSYVDDRGDFHQRVELDESSIASNFDCHLGCGIFELIRK